MRLLLLLSFLLALPAQADTRGALAGMMLAVRQHNDTLITSQVGTYVNVGGDEVATPGTARAVSDVPVWRLTLNFTLPRDQLLDQANTAIASTSAAWVSSVAAILRREQVSHAFATFSYRFTHTAGGRTNDKTLVWNSVVYPTGRSMINDARIIDLNDTDRILQVGYFPLNASVTQAPGVGWSLVAPGWTTTADANSPRGVFRYRVVDNNLSPLTSWGTVSVPGGVYDEEFSPDNVTSVNKQRLIRCAIDRTSDPSCPGGAPDVRSLMGQVDAKTAIFDYWWRLKPKYATVNAARTEANVFINVTTRRVDYPDCSTPNGTYTEAGTWRYLLERQIDRYFIGNSRTSYEQVNRFLDAIDTGHQAYSYTRAVTSAQESFLQNNLLVPTNSWHLLTEYLNRPPINSFATVPLTINRPSCACTPRSENRQVVCADGSGRVAGSQSRTSSCDGGGNEIWGAWAPNVDTSPANPACAALCTPSSESQNLLCDNGTGRTAGSQSRNWCADGRTAAWSAWAPAVNTTNSNPACQCTPSSESQNVMCADGSGRVAGSQTRTWCGDTITAAWSAWAPAAVNTSGSNPACAPVCPPPRPGARRTVGWCPPGMLGEVVTTCPYKCNLATARWVVDNDACTTVNGCYCPPGTTWNGSSCVCPAGTAWNSGTGTCDPIGGCGPQPADWVSTTACTPPQVGSTTTTCPYVCNGSSWVVSSSCTTTGGCGSSCAPYTESNTSMCADGSGRVAGTQTRTCCQDGVNPGNCSAWMPGTIDTSPTNPACATGGGACQAGWTTPPGAPAGTCCVNGQSWASGVQQCCSVPQPSTMRQEPWGSCQPGYVQKVPGYQTNTFDLPTCRWLGWVEVGPQCDQVQCLPPKYWDPNAPGGCKDPSRWTCWFYVSQFPEDPVPYWNGCGDYSSQSECQAALVRSWGTWEYKYGFCEN